MGPIVRYDQKIFRRYFPEISNWTDIKFIVFQHFPTICSWDFWKKFDRGGWGVLFFSSLLFWSYVIQYLCHTFLLYSTSPMHTCVSAIQYLCHTCLSCSTSAIHICNAVPLPYISDSTFVKHICHTYPLPYIYVIQYLCHTYLLYGTSAIHISEIQYLLHICYTVPLPCRRIIKINDKLWHEYFTLRSCETKIVGLYRNMYTFDG